MTVELRGDQYKELEQILLEIRNSLRTEVALKEKLLNELKEISKNTAQMRFGN